MLGAFTLLLAYQLVGEIITQAFHLHIPGPVIGRPFIIKRLPIGFFGKSGYRERMF